MELFEGQNLKTLYQRCTANFDDYAEIPGATLYEPKAGRKFYFIDNGAPILAIAHLDTVIKDNKSFGYGVYVGGTRFVISPQLDDRLGAWTILDILPEYLASLGFEAPYYDILLTDMEEVGQSTAQDFSYSLVGIPDRYNWMFQFDRRGKDVVFYMYENDQLTEIVKSHGFIPGKGSISDISYLYNLGIAGMNIGVGYHNEHHADCVAYESELWHNLQAFASLYGAARDVKLPNSPKAKEDGERRFTTPKTSYTSGWTNNGKGSWSSYDDDYWRGGNGSNDRTVVDKVDLNRLSKKGELDTANPRVAHVGAIVLPIPLYNVDMNAEQWREWLSDPNHTAVLNITTGTWRLMQSEGDGLEPTIEDVCHYCAADIPLDAEFYFKGDNIMCLDCAEKEYKRGGIENYPADCAMCGATHNRSKMLVLPEGMIICNECWTSEGADDYVLPTD